MGVWVEAQDQFFTSQYGDAKPGDRFPVAEGDLPWLEGRGFVKKLAAKHIPEAPADKAPVPKPQNDPKKKENPLLTTPSVKEGNPPPAAKPAAKPAKKAPRNSKKQAGGNASA